MCTKCKAEVGIGKDYCKCGNVINPRLMSKIDRNDEQIMSVKKVLDYGMNNKETKDKLTGLLAEIVGKMKG